MPGPAPTPKRGGGGTIFLTPEAESDAPAGMRAGQGGLVNGAEIWETVRSRCNVRGRSQHHLSLSVRDGPTGDAGSKVDVVLQFSTASGTYFIQHRGVPVIGAL